MGNLITALRREEFSLMESETQHCFFSMNFLKLEPPCCPRSVERERARERFREGGGRAMGRGRDGSYFMNEGGKESEAQAFPHT